MDSPGPGGMRERRETVVWPLVLGTPVSLMPAYMLTLLSPSRPLLFALPLFLLKRG